MRNYGKLKRAKYRNIILLCFFGFCAIALFTLNSCSSNTQIDPGIDAAVQAKLAQPVGLPGLPNLHKVSDDLYRGAQPSSEGMKQLEKLGVKTVVDLRSFHSDRDELKGTSLTYEHISMTALTPEDKDVVRFLKVATDPNRTPVFVHCKQGADRTGTMCAIYRIAVEGWSKDDAIEEMTKGGFEFHRIFQNLVKYIRRLDIDKIRNQAGLIEKN